MVTRGKATFRKRQKEMARKEKLRMKEERRRQKKLAHGNAGRTASLDVRTPCGLGPESESRAI